MLRLLNPAVTPVGGIRFVDPDTGFEYNKPYSTFPELQEHVTAHRAQNKLPPIDDLREVWEHWVCTQPGMDRKCCAVSADIKRNFEQYVSGGIAYFRRILSKEKFVSTQEAERRAAICADCNQNLVNIGHRHGQLYTDSMVLHETGGRRTSFDKKLFTCKICTCLLRAKVHFPSSIVAPSLSDTEIGRLNREPRSISRGQHLHCWQLSCLEETKEK